MKKIALIILVLVAMFIAACEVKETAKECRSDANEFYALCHFSCATTACEDNCYDLYILSYLSCGEDED
ncbi:MAG: hypothetical protein A2W19_11695 [Spirochaetes bacterium RBG_16_49_21]|nr:MAG: hypothetical protein A2W19_11695 [Spirochaetes bacterium RBG_16_49_21]